MMVLPDTRVFGAVTSVNILKAGDRAMEDLIKAHIYSNDHMAQLKQDTVCGCFYCGRIFHPSEITEWITADDPCGKDGTAICPYCGIDSVIGEISGFPITQAFLDKMGQYWFGQK